MTSNELADAFASSGLVIPEPEGPEDVLDELSFAITNDVIYGILHDLLLETHREAKTERAASAAVIVKQKALKDNPHLADDTSPGLLPVNTETKAAGALYKDGNVYLVENPLKATSEIVCPKCGLPRLLHPTTGKGAKAPKPGVEYCKKKPFIDKDYYDIHGQTFVPKGPGRGRKKEDMFDPVMQQLKAGILVYNCGGFQAASRMNKHMSKCIGGLSRESARNAKSKMFNGNEIGSQNGHSPPGSRNSTPVLRASSMKSSPGKRSVDNDDDDDSDEAPKKKRNKLLKKTQLAKFKGLNVKKMGGQMLASNLSFESKITDNEYDDGDADDTGDSSYISKPSKNRIVKSTTKMGAEKPKSKPVKKLMRPKKTSTSGNSASFTKRAMAESKSVSSRQINGTPPSEESSQTMSSPNAE
ncbi:transcriptional activator [Blumeria hordei DH14]|uniref:Transcriptional activator n=1 Tax=Blumeria graminis f. sp. hordei (strain DH14) TaxID=546991 RepID=A0A078N1L5_BLUG1|nr:transcriptional activator [Blumeria hordei DH14]